VHDGVRADAAIGVLLASEPEHVHFRLLEVEHLAVQLPGQRRSPRAMKGVVVVVEPHAVVKEGEQKHERRVGAGCLGNEREPSCCDPLPVALAVYRRILPRRPLKDGGPEPFGVRY